MHSDEPYVIEALKNGVSGYVLKDCAEIAQQLFISRRTAEAHRANLMKKLRLKTQTDLVLYAVRNGIISA